jgi:HPt (histidine-containing phosphotransfer) domain-containing protein
VQENGTPCFDPSVLTALCASMEISDTGYADELLQLFIDDTRRALDDIDASIASADLVTLRRCVHTLKSTASAVGALALAEEAGRHEAALRAGSDPDLHGLAQLPTSLAMFEQALSAWRAMPTRAPA